MADQPTGYWNPQNKNQGQEVESQQPLSMMTINANPNKKEDLLTIRLLESSERKMQLIKKLLSPEEFNSIALDLFANDYKTYDFKEEQFPKRGYEEIATSSVPTNYKNQAVNYLDRNKKLSSSDANLGLPVEAGSINLHEKLAKKREAVEFFFLDTDESQNQQSDLAIKLQSASYLRTNYEDEMKVLREPKFSLTDRFIGLLGLIGLSLDIGSCDEDEIGQDMREYQKEQACLPYTRTNNLLTMKRRLEADGQLDKIKFDKSERDKQETKLEGKYLDLTKLRVDLTSNSNLANHMKVKEFNSTGHFNRIKLAESKHIEFNNDSKLLVQGALVEKLVRLTQGRTKLPESTQQFCFKKILKVNLELLNIRNHSLMLAEERSSIELLENYAKIKSARENFTELTSKLLNLTQVVDGQETVNDEMKKVLESWCQLRDDLQAKERELLIKSNELDSLRKEQQFKSTSVLLKMYPATGKDKLLKIKVYELLKKMTDKKEQNEEQILSNLNAHDLDELRFEVETDVSELTPNEKCPLEEQVRRQTLDKWLKSLQVILLIGDKYKHECELTPRGLTVEFKSNVLCIPIQYDTSIDLTVEVYKKHTFERFTFYSSLLARNKIELNANESNYYTIKLQLNNTNDEKVEAELKFNTELLENNSNRSSQASDHLEKFVNSIYHDVFRFRHPFDDYQTKLSKLINKADLDFVLKALDLNINKNSYFLLDPFVEQFHQRELSKSLRNQSKIRAALIAWRWVNNLNQTIYLSERENTKTFNFQLDEFKNRLHFLPINLNLGYKLIEQTRAWAINYLKEFERKLIKMLEFEKEKGEQSSTMRLEDLLKEPELKFIDFSEVVKVVRRMIPKQTTRRPLMPQRKASRWATIIAQHDFLSSKASSDYHDDLEAQELGQQWHRLLLPPNPSLTEGSSQVNYTEKAISGPLQLVVSVQQATNVPMRVLSQPSGSRSRSTSPMGGIVSPTSFIQATPSVINLNYLSPATTYVEVIFQRKQQASSLAYGRNPQWNETLFFPINNVNSIPLPSSSNERTRQTQLVDDFLQLNLYDYNYYQQDNLTIPFETTLSGQRDLSTLELVSFNSEILNSNHPPTTLGAQRLLTSRQKVERHLLGTLRISLTTLMSTGKIEGSFSLAQPLLLENYQFIHDNTTLTQVNSPHPSQNEQQPIAPSDETQITLFITLDPPVSLPTHLYLPTGTIETDLVFEYSRLWEQTVSQYRYQIPSASASSSTSISGRVKLDGRGNRQKRHIKALVLHQDGRYCLIFRLLSPIEPPKSLMIKESDDKQQRILARFVALLSPMKYGLFNIRLLASSLWFDSKHLINMALGGPEEKAALLCNYYLYLGKCSALLLGDSIREGRCIYVIVWNEQTSRFLDEQLQLQAASLLKSMNASLGRPMLTSDLINSQGGCSIDKDNFIAKLPVLINSSSIQLWDPIIGKCYTLNERIPLVSVGSIVTLENVYANIQSTELPSTMNFDIRLKHLWLPLFEFSSSQTAINNSANNILNTSQKFNSLNKKTEQMNRRRKRSHLEQMRRLIGRPSMGPSLVDFNYTQYEYGSFNEQQSEEFKSVVERVVKAQLLKWRPDRPTYFNRTLSRLISEKLALFESYQLESPTEQQRWKSKLADLIKNEVLVAHLSSSGLYSRQVVSCPLNLPYTSMKTILDSVFASGVQNADLVLDSPDTTSVLSTQFLVACHVHPYPARVISLWLYVAAIVPNSHSSQRHLAA